MAALAKTRKLEYDELRKAFDAFLDLYPLCYGYWNKFAEILSKRRSPEAAIEVYERAVSAFPTSVDIWRHYLSFMTSYLALPGASSWGLEDRQKRDRMDRLFKRALEAAGKQHGAGPLYGMCITWLASQERWRRVRELYELALSVPLADCRSFMEQLEDFVRKTDAYAIATDEEKAEVMGKGPSRVNSNDPAVRLQQIILDGFYEQARATAMLAAKRRRYEERITRPYFHVKELEVAALRHWREYLDFEIRESEAEDGAAKEPAAPHPRVIMLFERCVVPTALYEQFWLKYAAYLESHGDIKGAASVLRRGSKLMFHAPPRTVVALAALEEAIGNTDAARALYIKLKSAGGGFDSVDMAVRVANFERRCGQNAAALEAFASCAPRVSPDAIAQAKAGFLRLVGDDDAAVKVLEEALHAAKKGSDVRLDKSGIARGLIELLIHQHERQRTPESLARAERGFDTAIEVMGPEMQDTVDRYRARFLDDYADSIAPMKKRRLLVSSVASGSEEPEGRPGDGGISGASSPAVSASSAVDRSLGAGLWRAAAVVDKPLAAYEESRLLQRTGAPLTKRPCPPSTEEQVAQRYGPGTQGWTQALQSATVGDARRAVYGGVSGAQQQPSRAPQGT